MLRRMLLAMVCFVSCLCFGPTAILADDIRTPIVPALDRPNDPTNRYEVAIFLAAIFSPPTSSQQCQFSDVPKDHPAASAIQSLVEKGLITSYPDGLFHGDNLVSRGEWATMLAKVASRPPYGNVRFPPLIMRKFEDISEDHWAYSSIEALGQVFQSDLPNFRVKDKLLRGEMETHLRNVADFLGSSMNETLSWLSDNIKASCGSSYVTPSYGPNGRGSLETLVSNRWSATFAVASSSVRITVNCLSTTTTPKRTSGRSATALKLNQSSKYLFALQDLDPDRIKVREMGFPVVGDARSKKKTVYELCLSSRGSDIALTSENGSKSKPKTEKISNFCIDGENKAVLERMVTVFRYAIGLCKAK